MACSLSFGAFLYSRNRTQPKKDSILGSPFSLNHVEGAVMSNAEQQTVGVPADRRAFMKSAVAVSTAVAAGGMGVVATAAEPAQQAQAAKAKLSGSVSVRFDPKKPPTDKDVHAVLEQIFRVHGCTTCGLGGIDLRLV